MKNFTQPKLDWGRLEEEQEALRELRACDKRQLRALLKRSKRYASRGFGLCTSLLRAEGDLSLIYTDCCALLQELIGVRLNGWHFLESWLERYCKEYTAPRELSHKVRDPRLIPTRLAWIDSLIEELCT